MPANPTGPSWKIYRITRLSVIISFLAAIPCILAGCGEPVNFCTLSPVEGDEIETETSVLIEGEIVFYGADGESAGGDFEMQFNSVIEKEITDTDNGLATEWVEKIEEDESIYIFNLEGEREKERENSPLLGEEVQIKVRNGRLRAKLIGADPTAEQDEELDNYSGAPEYDFYPDEDVKPGDQWDMDKDLMIDLTGMDDMDLKEASGTSKYVRNEEIDGVLCAVIESDLDLEGTFDSGDDMPPADVELTMTMTEFRSLDKGVLIKGEGQGTIKLAYDMGNDIRMEMDGDLGIEIDAEVD